MYQYKDMVKETLIKIISDHWHENHQSPTINGPTNP